jgi:bifunctional non-homologous end joining protein LigD
MARQLSTGPAFIPPMLATAARSLPPRLDDWACEFKFDGARALVAVHRGQVRVWSRLGRDITSSYPELAAITAVGGPALLLDGELVALTSGRPDFSRLQRRLHVARPGAALLAAVPVTLVVFDLLQVAARQLLSDPYRQRRSLLARLGLETAGVIVSPVFPGQDAPDVLAVASGHGYEGVVLKRPGSRYLSGRRTRNWLKIKTGQYCI